MASSFRNARVENLLIQYEQLKQSQQEIVEALRDELASALTQTDRATTELRATQYDLNATRSSLRSKQCEISNLSLQNARLERDLEISRYQNHDTRQAVAIEQQEGSEERLFKLDPVDATMPQLSVTDQMPLRRSKRTRLSSVGDRDFTTPLPTKGSERLIESDSPQDSKRQDLHSVITGPGRPLLRLPHKRVNPSYGREVDIPHVLWVQDNNQWSWVNFNSPPSGETALSECFTKMVNRTIPKRLRWAKFTRNRSSYRFDLKKMCINAHFSGSRRACTWVQAAGDQQWACDLCIKGRRPCVRFIKPSPNEDYAAAWCPLPPGEREGKQPNELRFWRR
ncbi:hypothetical protein C7974DRAFT_31912 [Boeremia exigua]|uniref:uncharacterized protein n=1 Tax=Boeremia exigua TaxID=749465 RepID=UPI001E8E19F1|nr:uncharacterized protein C7974DRAFT_31912 [Boeremia exigua]KAH6618536.1 hypothetical protein C7974DRAFT_31912 [Boeremia exigua]